MMEGTKHEALNIKTGMSVYSDTDDKVSRLPLTVTLFSCPEDVTVKEEACISMTIKVFYDGSSNLPIN